MGPSTRNSIFWPSVYLETSDYFCDAPREDEKKLYPGSETLVLIQSREEYERLFHYMPARIIDNLKIPRATISVVPWARIANSPDKVH